MASASIRNRQSETAECGLACLGMAAHLCGSEIDLPWLRQNFPISLRGANLRDLAAIASGIGMTTRAVRCEPDEFAQLRTPAILHWGFQHFVLLKKVRGKKLYLFDPSRGDRTADMAEARDYFTGVAMELAATPAFKKRRERPPLKLSSLLAFTPDIKSGLGQALILSVIIQIYVIASPFYIQSAIDSGALQGDAQLLTALAIGFGLFALFNAGAEALRGVALQKVSALLSWDMSQRLFRHMIRLPLPWFQKRRLADAMMRFQALDPLKSLIANGLIAALMDGLLAVTTLVMMFIYAPILAWVTIVGIALYFIVRIAGLPILLRFSADALQASIGEQSKRMETLRAIQTIKSMGGETERESVWANRQARVIGANQNASLTNLAFSTVQRVTDSGANVLVIFLGVRAILAGEFSIGALYAFMAYRTQFTTRASSLFDQILNWRMLEVYTDRLADVVLTPAEEGLDKLPAGLPDVEGAIELHNVAFRYGPTDPVIFRNISLKVEVGESIAIIAPSGTGKSTLLKVMSGLYPALAGEVRLDGLPLSAWGLPLVRRSIGVVMQDDELLPGSIADNVTFFSEEPDMERVWDCLASATLDEEVRAMPMQADTFVGDMGSALSGGQRQRVLLARALYKQPKVLILDEATSHLDMARERRINAALKELSITRIVVAHRPETIASADRIYRLGETLEEVPREHLQGGPASLRAARA
ncbi:peptidase domain-containing ABC transporter [Brevundimonas diminuta]|jgi:ATP-binding cassette, subfamily B, bacterial CvaB/MchF/RaxB|uniref:peptidase domain-containing ABC transporter n=1 Tax=Brevundimonas diminuta TaxID=293 RepID=UPI0030F7D3BB